MEIAPLIHSRTFYCDFSQNFAARPNDLNVHWAMNKILPAMRDVDILNGVRRMFATDGKTCIAGVACNFRYFVENYLSADERAEAANYLHDERGRELKIFLGYVFKDSGVPDVSESMLWQMFKQTVAKVWNNNPSDTVIVPYESCGVKSVAKRTLDKKFYPSNERDNIELFEQCIAARKDFCSNVDAVKIFEDGKYEVITAAQSVINRIQEAQAQKQEAQKKNATYGFEQPRSSYGTTAFTGSTFPKPENSHFEGKREPYIINTRSGSGSYRNSSSDILNKGANRGATAPKGFKNIDELCADINQKYSNVTFGDDLSGTYRLTNIGKLDFKGTLSAISDYLAASYRNKNVKLVLLIAEEIDE